jgi:hypothetical protein
MIDQEELPLRRALAVPRASQPVTMEIGVGASGLQPWCTVVLAGPQSPSEPGSSGQYRDALEAPPKSAPPALAATQPVMNAAPRAIIEDAVVPPRGGRRRGHEKYPFASLTPVVEDENGELSGSCIFIPDCDEPRKHIAKARKRYRDRVFITRTTSSGKMIWRQC